MASWRIARSKSKLTTGILFYFVLSMMLPFQTIMIPLMQIVAGIGLTASLGGYILVATALICPFTIYLYRGFYGQIPIEIEEAAKIDGANPFQTFFMVVFPLLKPITITVLIINVMNVWNDFLLALLMLQRRDKMTLTISVMQYTGQYNLQWNLTLATLAIVILPVIILYLCLQNSIQSGLVAGSVKG
jgi:raffinose/stachyose/melibiose transport system permease protein